MSQNLKLGKRSNERGNGDELVMGKVSLLSQINNLSHEDNLIIGKGIVTDGLVVWLDGIDFKNSPPSTSWRDLSLNNNNATINNFSYDANSGSDGKGSIVYDGVDDYAVVPNNSSLDVTTGFTAMFEFTPSEVDTRVLLMLGSGSSKLSFECFISGNIVVYRIDDSNGLNNIGNQDVSIGTSKTIIVTYDNSLPIDNIKVYEDDPTTPVITANYTGILTTGYDLGIGAFPDGLFFYGGSMSYILFYNRGLSGEEVTQNCNVIKNWGG